MVTEFLTRHGMDPDQVDLSAACLAFQQAMAAGLAGRPSSILMLPTYLTHEGPLPQGVPVAVIDAGGTNARVARVTFAPAGPLVEGLEVFPMPGTLGEVSREEFFDQFARRLLPLLPGCAAIGFCFSFPASIGPDRDGTVLYFDKEVKVADSPGMVLLRGLRETLAALGGPRLGGVVLNDTVAALMGGVTQTDPASWDGFVGLIYGTGINVCYAEPVGQIAALRGGCSAHSMLINTESGGLDGLPGGAYDRALDAASRDPGRHTYEKMVSGAYLGEVLRRTLAGAAGEGLLPPAFAALERLATWEADAFLADPLGENPLARLCADDAQRAFVTETADRLMLRAAKLVVANLAAVLERSDLGRDPARPACIVVEGSTFYKSQRIRPHMEGVLRDYVEGVLGRHTGFLKPENANLIGTAAAALLNR